MTVLAAYTDDNEGNAALTAAVAEAQRRNEDLLIVNLGAPDRAADAVRDNPVLHRTLEVGDSDDAIGDLLDEADRVGASAIVVGIRHRSPVGKLALSAVSRRILLEATTTVVAVKPGRA